MDWVSFVVKHWVNILTIIISGIGAAFSYYFSVKARSHARTVMVNDYISEAVQEFAGKGTPANYIRSLVLSNEEKEIIWKNCHLRYKGRYPDRLFSDTPMPSSAMGYSIGECKPIMEALGSGQYEDRTAKSLSEETRMDVEHVQKGLSWFFENGLVQKRTADDGTFWSLTDRGWNVHEDIQKTKLSQETKAGGN